MHNVSLAQRHRARAEADPFAGGKGLGEMDFA